ncbi:MAG: hypothetical protein GX818_04210 [Tissierellia bacterium]|nr:hypothetical protein [Tissierellia bacterium]
MNYYIGFPEGLEKAVGSSFNAAESFELCAINRKINEEGKLLESLKNT